jgi:signal transduction histidine kinase
MAPRPIALRKLLTSVTVLLTTLAVGIAVALVVLTTYMQRVSGMLATSVDSVQLAEEAEIALLLHGRTNDPLVRRQLGSALRTALVEARKHIATNREATALATAERRVESYLDADTTMEESALAEAYAAIEQLVDLNVAQARESQATATRVNHAASAIGISTSALLIAVAAALVWWLHRRAFRPVLGLARAMKRFGEGDLEARAREEGPAELREMSRRFNEMAASLKSQRVARLAFLAAVAHDLRTPLTALAMAVPAVRDDKPLPPEPRLRRTMELVRRQIHRLERMVADLLDTARIESGKLRLEQRAVDLGDMAHDVVELFDGTSPDHRIVFHAEPLCLGWCDPVRAQQVLTNLVSNAIKYSPDGGVVEIRVALHGDHVAMEVRDEGLGIAPEDQERLFEPFRRVGLSKEAIPGVGLGLYVVRRLVEAHGGRISVTSAPGEGSCFRVTFPIARQSSARERAGASPHP